MRLDLLRDRADGRYRWHIEDAVSKPFSRRIDCMAQACRILGVDPTSVTWLAGGPHGNIYDYGQIGKPRFVEIFVWKRWWRR